MAIRVFFYTGKTHTIVGSDAEPGITSRVVHHMQDKIRNRPDCSMYYSYLEIYQEKVSMMNSGIRVCDCKNVVDDITADHKVT